MYMYLDVHLCTMCFWCLRRSNIVKLDSQTFVLCRMVAGI